MEDGGAMRAHMGARVWNRGVSDSLSSGIRASQLKILHYHYYRILHVN